MPRKSTAPVTLERLKELFDYSPTTGEFTWKEQHGAARVGEVAGGIGPIGYRYLSVDYAKFTAQQAAWFYTHGVWPEQQVGRKNGDRADNRIDNLFLIQKDKSVVTFEDVSRALDYDPETGKFVWKVATSRKVKSGQEAGRLMRPKAGAGQYRYIGLGGKSIPASQLAWLLSYGEWPDRSISFEDGDTTNLRIANLKLARFAPLKALENGRRVYKMVPDATRHYGLRHYYGIGIDDYNEMLAAQNGVCAICEKPEKAKVRGKVKPLSVDHSHTTGKVRALLCSSCNHLLGHAFESAEVLRAAALYLEQHADCVGEA